MDLSSTVLAFAAPQSISVVRPAADTFDVHGRALPRAAASTFTCAAVVYPEGRALKRDDPAGFSPSDVLHLLTPTALRPRDLIQVAGETTRLEVEKVLDWTAVGGFCEAVARRAQAPFEPQTGGIP